MEEQPKGSPEIESSPGFVLERATALANTLAESGDRSLLVNFTNERETSIKNSIDQINFYAARAWIQEAAGQPGFTSEPDFMNGEEDRGEGAAYDYYAAAYMAYQEGRDAEYKELLYRARAVAGPPAPQYLNPNFVGIVADKAMRTGREDDAQMLYHNASVRAGGQGDDELSQAFSAAAEFASMEDHTDKSE